MSLERPAAWCPRCGAEYREGFTACSDCLVTLVDHAPLPDDHEPATIAVGGIAPEERTAIRSLMTIAGIAHSWAGDGELLVGKADEEATRQLVGEALHPRDPVAEPPTPTPDEIDPDLVEAGPIVASRSQRLLGYVVDSLLWGAIVMVVNALRGPAHLSALARLAAFALPFGAYQVVGVAVWGRTLGKVVCSTAVVDGDGDRPGWLASIVRWLVPAAVAAAASPAAPWLDPLVLAVVYAPIAFRADGRGLHDLAAGTWVVDLRARGSFSA